MNINRFVIRNAMREYWTGRAWSKALSREGFPLYAKSYDRESGAAIIKKRFNRGVRSVDHNGKAMYLRPPKLIPEHTSALEQNRQF